MSASNEWTEWHLTPAGWVSGSRRVDVANITTEAPPADRVISYRYQEYMSSMYSQMDKELREIWKCDDSALISQLSDKFGPCPHSL